MQFMLPLPVNKNKKSEFVIHKCGLECVRHTYVANRSLSPVN